MWSVAERRDTQESCPQHVLTVSGATARGSHVQVGCRMKAGLVTKRIEDGVGSLDQPIEVAGK
jgi:hypothetical protein